MTMPRIPSNSIIILPKQEKNQSQKIAAILNLSNVYQNTGRINEAIDLLEKTIKTEKLSAVQKGNLFNNLGNNYVLSYKKPAFSKPIPDIFKKLESSHFSAIQFVTIRQNTKRNTGELLPKLVFIKFAMAQH